MKKFIIRVSVFSVILLAVCYILGYMADKGQRQAKNNEVSDWRRIVDGDIDTDILVTGSSRAMRMIDPKIIENITNLDCYNIGMEGARLRTQKTRWDTFLKYNSPPQLIVQTVDLMSMGHGKTIFKKQQYLPFLSEESIYDNLAKLDDRLFLDRYFPLYKYHGYFEEFKKGLLLFFDGQTDDKYTMYKGYEPKDKLFNNEFRDMKDTLTTDELLHPVELIEEGFRMLNSMKKDCFGIDTKLVIVLTPQYKGLTDLQSQMDSLIIGFEDFANVDQVYFLNYIDVPYSSDTTYFYNAMHLNLKGANVFSNQLAKDIDVILKQ